jgi:hypothetical protein
VHLLRTGAVVAFSLSLSHCQGKPFQDLDLPHGKTHTFTSFTYGATTYETDLLFVVDNSPSMKDKQALLVKAIPALVRRLILPNCRANNESVVPNPGICPPNTFPEFPPRNDLHVGILTSSLGGHGSDACPRNLTGKDDQGRLIPSVRSGVPDPEGTGFLAWRGGSAEEAEAFIELVRTHVEAVGSDGCEYPAPLEAWYRFFVDPNPPQEIVVDADGHSLTREEGGEIEVDRELLRQREAFLRPESELHIVAISDQDDCSLMDGGPLYEHARLGHMLLDDSLKIPRPPGVCAQNSNDPCCFSCLASENAHPECDTSACEFPELLPAHEDRQSLRCFDTKKRFGIELRYPLERYVNALTAPTLIDARTSHTFDNPILTGIGVNAGKKRNPSLVFFTGLVGVPWQDVATDASLTDPNVMQPRNAAQLLTDLIPIGGSVISRWDLMLGHQQLDTSSPPGRPLDPFLIQSISPRTIGYAHPITLDVIVGADSNSPTVNHINGHEARHDSSVLSRYPDGSPANDTLQASCIFPLEEPVLCEPGDPSCLCSDEPSRNRAACQPLGGGPAGLTQYFAEARSAPRVLQVLRDVGQNSLVGSLCPKFATGEGVFHSGYGFNWLADAWSDRDSGGRYNSRALCLAQQLPVDDEGHAPCVVVETWAQEKLPHLDEVSTCAEPGRAPVDDDLRALTLRQLKERGMCDGRSRSPSCSGLEMCQLTQLTGGGLDWCILEPRNEEHLEPGYCYVDDEQLNSRRSASEEESLSRYDSVLRNCRSSRPAALHFTGPNTPRANSVVFIACQTTTVYSSAEVENPYSRDLFPFPRPDPQEIPPPP